MYVLSNSGVFGESIFFVTISKAPNESALEYLKMECMYVDLPKLVVLDDVWSGSEDLIERFLSDVPALKVLVTSRFQFRRYRSIYKLKLLNHKDATKLFCDSAFHPNDPMPDAEFLDKVLFVCLFLALYPCTNILQSLKIFLFKYDKLKEKENQSINCCLIC